MTGRGGKRENAGRKSRMPPPDVTKAIRDDCESRSNMKREKQAHARHSRQLAKRGVVWEEDGLPNPVLQVPLKYRAIVSQYGSAQPKKKIPEDLPEKVKYAIDRVRTNKKAGGAYSIKLPRLYRKRQAIIAAVARSWGVSQRTVRTIWETTV
jgi:hypothetical protein